MIPPVDFIKANRLVDLYVHTLQNPGPRLLARQVAQRSWLEFRMQEVGLIEDIRKLRFMESHTLWYACLIITGRTREVSRLEKQILGTVHTGGRTTEITIRRTLKDTRNIVGPMLRDLLERSGHKLT